jgi:hypothetical protein
MVTGETMFAAQSNPPCTVQVTDTQGNVSKVVTLTGIDLGTIAYAQVGASGTVLNAGNPSRVTNPQAGDNICQSATVTSATPLLVRLGESGC